MRKLRVVKRMLICLILAFVMGLALTGNAFAISQTQSMTTSAPAIKKSKSSIEGSWKLQLTQKQFQDPTTRKQITEFRVFADLRYEPLQDVYFLLAPKFTYANGFIQTQDEQGATKAEWGVREASINGDLNWLQGSLGALDQTPLHPSLLLEEQTFPAGKLLAFTDSKKSWQVIFQAEAAMPTSSSLSPQTRTFEKTPGYQSLALGLKTRKLNPELNLQLGAFQYQDLPTSVATKSALLGNTAPSTNGMDAKFTYEYAGSFAELNTKIHVLPRLIIGADLEWLQNSKAPETLNQAYLAKGFAEFRIIRNFEITPFYEYYRIEPDSAVAMYNSDMFGTNRVGYRGGLSVTYKQTLRISVSSGERDVIFESPYQQREKTLNLRLETLDVAI